MQQARVLKVPAGEWGTFFREFLKHPLQIGSVIPSSRYLEQRLLRSAELASARLIVELGAGTGGTTRSILNAMPSGARLLSIEVNPTFIGILRQIGDGRFIPHLGKAQQLPQILAHYQLPSPDIIISGIPFSTMSEQAGSALIAVIADVLHERGRFVAYQVSRRVDALCRPRLGVGRSELELRNIPPMRVYRWEKANSHCDMA